MVRAHVKMHFHSFGVVEALLFWNLSIIQISWWVLSKSWQAKQPWWLLLENTVTVQASGLLEVGYPSYAGYNNFSCFSLIVFHLLLQKEDIYYNILVSKQSHWIGDVLNPKDNLTCSAETWAPPGTQKDIIFTIAGATHSFFGLSFHFRALVTGQGHCTAGLALCNLRRLPRIKCFVEICRTVEI